MRIILLIAMFLTGGASLYAGSTSVRHNRPNSSGKTAERGSGSNRLVKSLLSILNKDTAKHSSKRKKESKHHEKRHKNKK